MARDLAHGVTDTPSFCQFICTHLLEFDGSISVEAYVKKLFLEYDLLLKSYQVNGIIGSTATVCLLFQDNIYLAYVGDSAAMVIQGDQLLHQTLDHSVYNNPEESERMEKAKVVISPTPDFVVKNDFELQVIEGKCHNFAFHYLNDRLAMTRAFGHYSVKDYKTSDADDTVSSACALIVEPTVFTIPLQEGIEIVMGSDGLWDVIKDDNPFDEVYSILQKAKEKEKDVSEAFTKFAESRWKQEWSVLSDKPTVCMTMTHPIQWDDISCYYLKF